MSKFFSTLSLIACALLAVGCSHNDKDKEKVQLPPRQCPQVALVRDLQLISDYGQNAPDAKELVAMGALRDIKGDCRYSDKGVDIRYTLYMAAARGPRLGGDKISFPFFVALLDPSGQIVKKDMLTTDFTFSGSDKRVEKEQEMHVFIPLPDDKTTAEGYRILTGFQLTQPQIDAVRQAKDKRLEGGN